MRIVKYPRKLYAGTNVLLGSILLVLIFNLAVCAHSTPIDEYYKTRAAAEKAFAAGDTPTAFAASLCCADIAEHELGRADWAVWRYNNLGYHLILEFQAKTDILERQSSLEVVRPEFRNEYKKELKTSMAKHIKLLYQARAYLLTALQLESQVVPKSLKSKTRLTVIMDNLHYAEMRIKYVRDEH